MNIKLTQFIVESSGSYITILNYISNGNISNSVSTLNSLSAAEQLLNEYTTSLAAGLAGAGATNINVGTLENYTTYKKKNITFDIQVSDTIDYSNILSSINTNLTNLNTNFQNKNNQSDIVSCLNNIFCYEKNNSFFSAVKDSSLTSSELDNTLKSNNIMNMLFNILSMLSNTTLAKNSISSPVSNRVINDISKKLSVSMPVESSSPGNNSIRDLLYGIICCLSPNSGSYDSLRNNGNLKAISDKLANANDLHTISQAIDLISTALAQTNNTLTNTNTDLGNIATNINSIQSNPLIEVNIDVPYEVKNLTKKDTEY